MRRTGIHIIGDVPWGTHFCQFYQDKQDLIGILVPYFRAGLENNEFCMWVTSEPLRAEEAKAALAGEVEDLDRYIRNGQLEILDYSQWYTLGGKFDSDRVLQGWADRLEAATKLGFDGLRLTGNTFWLEKSDWQSFTDYEAAVDGVIGQYRMLAICTYSLARCGAAEIMDVVGNHAFALIKRAGQWQIVESALRKKTEASLQTVLNSITDGLLVLDRNWICTYFSEQGAHMVGMRAEDIIGRSVWEVFPQATGTKFYECYHRAVEIGLPVQFEEFYPEPVNKWFDCHCYPSAEGLSVYFHDITARKRAEANQDLLAEILRVLNRGGALRSLIADTLRLIRESSGFDAVGLRLRQGEDCPYYEQSGFTKEFLREENFLCAKGPGAVIVRDAEGRAVLECTCGVVLSGRTDPGMSCFTKGGSFWTNVSSELLALAPCDDPRTNPRNRCIYGGYQSVGLFPVRVGREIIGLLQLNDRREGRFTPELIDFYETVAQNIGLALQRTSAEEALRESESFHRQTLDSIPGMIFTTRPDGYCDYQSQQWADYTGVPMSEHLGDGWNRLLHPEDRPRAFAAWRTAVEGRAPYDLEYRVRRHDGEYEWFKVTGRPIRDAAGQIVRWFGVAVNIEELKRSEEALRESEQRLRLFIEHTPAAVAVVDREMRYLAASRRWISDYRLSHANLIGRSHYEIFPEIPERWREVHRRCLSGAVERCEEDFFPRADGTLDWLRWEIHPWRTAAGEIGGIILFSEVITERKHAKERIRHHNAVLEGINRILSEALAVDTEQELGRKCLVVAEQVTGSKFGFLAELSAEGRLNDISISDPGWQACRLDEPTGHSPPSGFKLHGIYGRVLLDGKGFFTNDPGSRPDRIGTPQGHPPLKAFLGVPLKHEGKAIGMIAVANREGGYRQQDLEALEALAGAIVQVLMRKRAEQAVRDGEERLRQAQKMESIGVLAGGIAHDFNNLLTSILGNASLLQMDAAAGNGQKLKAIIESSEKAAALTRQLLAYAGKGQFQITDFDVSRLVRSSADLLRVSIPKNIGVELDVPRNLPAVRGDSSQIQQVVMNLVINAAEAIEGRSDGKVSISAGIRDFDAAAAGRVAAGIAPGRYVSITVSDNGCGMDELTSSKIFDPFFTTKFTGRGLGLAAVHGILRSHKGAITVETSPGQGSTFTVYLLCREERAAAPGREKESPAGLRGATVLVVDDEEPVRAFTKAALERLGHTVLLADNGRQALDLLSSRGDVELVLLDIIMPVVGGVEAFSEMRKKWPKLAILINSGYSRQEACRLGMPSELPFLEKPYTVQKLGGAVEEVLKAHSRHGD